MVIGACETSFLANLRPALFPQFAVVVVNVPHWGMPRTVFAGARGQWDIVLAAGRPIGNRPQDDILPYLGSVDLDNLIRLGVGELPSEIME
jgi:hypothetical protein